MELEFIKKLCKWNICSKNICHGVWYDFVATRKTTKRGFGERQIYVKRLEPSYGALKLKSEEKKQTKRCEETVR